MIFKYNPSPPAMSRFYRVTKVQSLIFKRYFFRTETFLPKFREHECRTRAKNLAHLQNPFSTPPGPYV